MVVVTIITYLAIVAVYARIIWMAVQTQRPAIVVGSIIVLCVSLSLKITGDVITYFEGRKL